MIQYTSSNIQEVLYNENKNISGTDLYNANKRLDNELASIIKNDMYIDTVFIITNTERKYLYKGYIDLGKDTEESEWYRQVKDAAGNLVVMNGFPRNNISKQNNSFIFFGTILKDLSYQKTLEPLGMLGVILNTTIFEDSFEYSNISEYSSFDIIDRNRQNILSDNKLHINDLFKNKENISKIYKNYVGYFFTNWSNNKGIIVYGTYRLYDWKIILFIPNSFFYKEINNISLISIVISMLCLFMIFTISIYLKKNFFKPLLELATAMNRVGMNDLDVNISSSSQEDLGIIVKGFNSMVGNIKELFNQTISKERQKIDAEIKALKYQINPHFLYNSLNSIRAIAAKNNDNVVVEMTIALSRFLRNTISSNNMMVNLRTELNNIQDYLYLIQIRYNNRIKIEYFFNEEVFNYKIPGMILQPILENAITHGLNRKLNRKEDAILRISGYIKETNLFIDVWDNGKGMTKNQIKFVLDSSFVDYSTGSIGINNIQKRIVLEFGVNYGITIDSKPECFTLVSIKLPLITDKEMG